MGTNLPDPNISKAYLDGSGEEEASRGIPATGPDPRAGIGTKGKISMPYNDPTRRKGPSIMVPRGGGFGIRARHSGRGR